MRDGSDRETPVGKITSEEVAFSHPYFKVVRRTIEETPGGPVREQLLWDRGGEGAVAVAIDEDDNFILVEEPKYGQMRRFISCAAGYVRAKKGESPLEAAKRELREETGYEARKWVSIHSGTMIDFPDKTDGGEHHFFLAVDARQTGEPEEYRTVVKFSRLEIEFMLTGQELPDHRIEIAMTHVALSCALLYMDANH